MRTLRLSVLLVIFAGLEILFGGVASAHVTPDPPIAVRGAGDQVFTFRVPNETSNANTITVKLQLPQDHPIAAVEILEIPGWSSTITSRRLAVPLKTDDGTISEVVSAITWTGGSISPGRYGEFKILAMGLPSDGEALVFKAVQIYDDGKTVNWAGTDKGARYPAPVVTLSDPGGNSRSASHVVVPASSSSAASTSGDSTKGFAIDGIILGGLALLIALVALMLGRRKRSLQLDGSSIASRAHGPTGTVQATGGVGRR